ncbi:hypothetical protein ACFX12_023378 [Malus domestica]
MKDRPRWKYGKPFGEGTWREGNKSGNHILLRVYRSEQRMECGWLWGREAKGKSEERWSFGFGKEHPEGEGRVEMNDMKLKSETKPKET